MDKIIVTGPESSGKTTICQQLSTHFKIPFTKEFARDYIDNLDKEYLQKDLIEIAKGQLKNEQLTTNNKKLSLHDTDLITIKIWSNYKYGSCDKWIINQIEKQKTENRFYLLCKPDIPWEADPLRENSQNREELFEIYKKELEKLKHNYVIIEGEERIKNSISKISSLMSNN
ncbi:MAG: ATP-binding protein [Flavobacteriales bacterium]|nr:ATP-binding protein [Flavobacteriales bacterium]